MTYCGDGTDVNCLTQVQYCFKYGYVHVELEQDSKQHYSILRDKITSQTLWKFSS